MEGQQQNIQQPQSPTKLQKTSSKNLNKHKCPHYERECIHYFISGHVQAPCCKIFYPCKLCHDQKYQYKVGCQVQRMAFDKVQNLKCLQCETIQPPSQQCINPQCKTIFGEYACLKCKLYQNNPKKDDCGMCRRGVKENFFHCHKCGYCRHISQQGDHKCNENVAESQCPICLEVLKYSTQYYTSLPCGHLIHNKCLKSVQNINCPVCGMAMQKMSKQQNQHIQKLIDQTKDELPQEVKNHKVNILCNECLHKTTDAPFHYYGIKCEKCGTFNTKMI